jgi:putative ABC transport system ATP-binding protein
MAGCDVAVRDLLLTWPAPGGGRFTALDLDALDVPAGGSLAVTGASGSGKTSLLYVLAGLERPRRGSVRIGGTELSGLSEGARDRWRRATLGFVFQDFRLFPGLDALGNVLLPASFSRLAPTAAERRRAAALLERVGIRDSRQAVETMSRGEMQRVAVARAVMTAPGLMLADEPTASLDAMAAAEVAAMLLDLCALASTTLIVVTHDAVLARRLDATCHLDGGRIQSPGYGAAGL